MARISGVDLPANKSILIGLTYIYGIGLAKSKLILKAIDIDPTIKTNQLNEEQILKIRNELSENYIVEGELRAETKKNIKRLMDIGCYRGIRHRTGLPLRGQKTKNNSRTRKGKKKTVAGKKGV